MSYPGSCRCGRHWDSPTAAHCSVCHAHFSTVQNFDRHEPSRRGCKNPGSLTRTRRSDGREVPLLKQVQRSDGPVWVSAMDAPEVPA